MRDFLFTSDGFINLSNVIYISADKENPETKTALLGPGVQVVLNMPYSETRAMIEKLVRDQYEYDVKWYQHSADRRKQELDEMVDKLTGHHG